MQLNEKAIIIKIQLGKTGLFFATSPDLKGLLVAERTLDSLYEQILIAILSICEASGQRVNPQTIKMIIPEVTNQTLIELKVIVPDFDFR